MMRGIYIDFKMKHCKGYKYLSSQKTRSTIAMDPWHLKVKEKGISLTKNYWIIISIQQISSIQIFILKTNQILKGMAIFDHLQPKIIESTFSFPEFVPACKKSVYSICIFRYRQFQSSMTRMATPIFDHTHPKKF